MLFTTLRSRDENSDATNLQHIDNNFKEISNNDFDLNSQNMSTEVASITTREIQEIRTPYNDLYMKVDIPDAYRVDARSFIERPFYVDEVVFPNTAVRYSFLQNTVKFLPGDIARSNPSVLNMFKMAAYGRPDMVLNISMAGTITHAGCVLVGVLPPMPAYPIDGFYNKNLINTLLSGPHAFLHANEATSVALNVPWFCNTDLATTDMEISSGYQNTLDITEVNGNYATLVYMVLNPLTPSTGSSNSLRIVVEACFKNFDLAVPTPRFVTWTAQSGVLDFFTHGVSGLIDNAFSGLKRVTSDALDYARNVVRDYTGLHNPNVPMIQERVITTPLNFQNNVDTAQFFEKLDPFTKFDRIVKEPLFGSSVDEMSLSHILTKRQFIGSFQVTVNDGLGKMVWARPISPFQGGIRTIPLANVIEIFNNIELIHSMSRGWRGGLKLTIQSVMNNKQQCKLKVIKMYNPSVKATTAYPTYQSIANAPTHLLEFTQGGQEHQVELPYLCRNDITPCANNTDFEALFHGLYYIYVAQPLVKSDSSPENIEFNLYIEGCPDLTFYGYATSNTYHTSFNLVPEQSAKLEFEAQSGNSMKVMNEPQKQDKEHVVDTKEEQLTHMTRLMPILDIRPYIRRMYKSDVTAVQVSPLDTFNTTLRLGALLGEDPNFWRYTPIESFSRMYYGKSVGFKFRLMLTINAVIPDERVTDIDDIGVRVYYLPQNVNNITTTRTIVSAPCNTPYFPNPHQPSDDAVALPFQIVGKESNRTHVIYEFVVPDTSFYKFMGGPDKFRNFNLAGSIPVLSQADFGSLVIQYTNLNRNLNFEGTQELFIGLTDESRFGFHVIAPGVRVYKGDKSLYLGTNTSFADPTNVNLNPFIYRGGFL